MKRLILPTLAALALLLTAGLLTAANPETVRINAVVAERLTLTFTGLGTGNSVNFADADPDVTPSIPATENAVTVQAKARTGASRTVRLSVAAPTALTSGSDTIDISNVTWTSTGAGYVAGTMGAGPVTVGNWTGSGDRTGTLSYFLANSWSYATGNYTTTVTYTLAVL